MRLILIRHAATAGNGARYVGREDLPLSAEGERQASALADRLAHRRIDAVYSSPLMRALRTAAPIAGHRGLDIRVRDALIEIDFGTLQGSLKHERPLSLKRLHLDTPMPGGESLTDVWHRLAGLSAELGDELCAGRTIAVVGHYWSNRILSIRLQASSLRAALSEGSYKPANASALALDFDRRGDDLRIRNTEWIACPSH